jgi:hypothetical protein
MVAKIISSGEQGRLAGEMTPAAATTTEQERLAGEVTPAAGTKDAKSDFDWVGMLKKLGNAGAAGLSRWGKDLMGAPEAQTPWEVEQAQTFETAKAKQAQEAELQRTAAVAQIQAQQAAVENQYQMQRMNLQNQMNVANIPIEAKSELAKQMAVLDQQHKNDVDLMEKNYGVYFAKLGVQPGADPGIHFGGG